MEAKQMALESLEKVAKEQNYVDYTVAIESVNGHGNVMSASFRVTLSAPEKPDMKLIVKVATMNDKIRKESALMHYEAELQFYSKLQKVFEKLEEKYNLPENQRVRTPKLYGLRDDYSKETLVLEDLTVQGFQDFSRDKALDMESMCAGIDLMAKFHALSMAYYRDDLEGFGRTSASIAMKVDYMGEFFQAVKLDVLANALASVQEEYRTRLQKYFEKSENYTSIMEYYSNHGRNIIIHGDFKPSNLMYRRRNGKLELAILDFQMIHDGDPVAELMYFIFTGTDEQFRRAHYHELLDLYYERLRAALRNLRLEPEKVYPERVYRAKLQKSTMLGLVLAVVLLPVILVEDDKAPGLGGENAVLSDLVSKGSALYKERFKGVMNNFVEWGLL